MKARFSLFYETLRASYWWIPSLTLAGSGGLAVVLILLDERIEDNYLHRFAWIFSGGAEGARALLSTVAGSVIGVAGTTFTITIAVLSLTGSQFGPRLLRGFLRDTGNQFVLGTFVGTFLYCLLVLRTVRSVEESYFVPHLAVTGGMILAILSIGVLVYFIHHVSVSIQASRVIGGVAEELEKAIDRLYPEEVGVDDREDVASSSGEGREPAEGGRESILAERSGYIMAIDGESVLELAKEMETVIRLRARPGQFLIAGSEIASIAPSEKLPPDFGRRIRNTMTLGDRRTAPQDVEFLILELTEVAVRALSPGVNDPFTAIQALDRLTAGFCHLAGRVIPSGRRYDTSGNLRVVAATVTFTDLAQTAFREIGHYVRKDPAVSRRLRESFEQIRACAPTEEQRAAIHTLYSEFRDGEETVLPTSGK
ncbi:MAG: DUF2254 domain-containing protein [Capsulimonadales bacterium]|nr:DUF2254 domain-containing protein [Capsulimonadales bacterium]